MAFALYREAKGSRLAMPKALAAEEKAAETPCTATLTRAEIVIVPVSRAAIGIAASESAAADGPAMSICSRKHQRLVPVSGL